LRHRMSVPTGVIQHPANAGQRAPDKGVT